ncbi:hypothetical protein RRG08_033523 [Elysia crispata]|uniref:Ig-like domain-containing protein n=1 Tax=Elysia crispata TaxID=231223 RepID=A0AAE0XNQ6_9GAST|nr:hypothetical protein RRG08_033523 [Elysia crispata]
MDYVDEAFARVMNKNLAKDKANRAYHDRNRPLQSERLSGLSWGDLISVYLDTAETPGTAAVGSGSHPGLGALRPEPNHCARLGCIREPSLRQPTPNIQTMFRASQDLTLIGYRRHGVISSQSTDSNIQINALHQYRIEDKSSVVLKRPRKKEEISVGSDVLLKCQISGNPVPDIYWYRNDYRTSRTHILPLQSLIYNQLVYKPLDLTDNTNVYPRSIYQQAKLAFHVLKSGKPVNRITVSKPSPHTLYPTQIGAALDLLFVLLPSLRSPDKDFYSPPEQQLYFLNLLS